jgi:perosamine synthetase
MNPESVGVINGVWMPTVVFDTETGITREKLQAVFAEQNIDARVFFHPLSSLPMFKALPDNIISWDIPKRAINLPSFHDITQLQQNRINDLIIDCLGNLK